MLYDVYCIGSGLPLDTQICSSQVLYKIGTLPPSGTWAKRFIGAFEQKPCPLSYNQIFN